MIREHENELARLVHSSAWLMRLLRAARAVDAPDWWIGGGVLRDLVWDTRAGSFDPARVKDVDLAFFDPHDLSQERDRQVQAALSRQAPDVVWDAKNQAAVHTWYPARFGLEVGPLLDAADGVATWPETATAVAVRLDEHDGLAVTAAHGLHDLLEGVCRRNRRRVSAEEYARRLQRKQVSHRWPHVQIVAEELPAAARGAHDAR